MKISKKDIIYLSIISVLSIAIIFTSVVFNMPSNNNNNDYYQNKCASYKVQNSNLSKGQIVFLGDSITDLYCLDEFYNTLDLATYNRGIGGDTTQGLLDRLQVSALDLQPSKIVLMIGANDVYGNRSNEYIINKYNQILTQIKQHLPSTQVFCMSVISQSESFTQYFDGEPVVQQKIQQIMQLNPQIQSLAEGLGYEYVDLFTPTIVENNFLNPNYTDDGLHLNHQGFEVWTNILKPLLI